MRCEDIMGGGGGVQPSEGAEETGGGTYAAVIPSISSVARIGAAASTVMIKKEGKQTLS